MVEYTENALSIDRIVELRKTVGSVLRSDLEDMGQFTGISTSVFDRNGSRYTLFYDDRSRKWAPFQATVEPLYEEQRNK